MSESKHSWLMLIASAVLGGLIGGLAEEFLDHRRELRENTQSFAIAFNDTYFGTHRDKLQGFYFSRDVQALVDGSLTRSEYSREINILVSGNPDILTSVLAIGEFYRTINVCAQERRCGRESVRDAFQGYAIVFYRVFYPVLRRADCDIGLPNLEQNAALLAGLLNPPDEVCRSSQPFE